MLVQAYKIAIHFSVDYLSPQENIFEILQPSSDPMRLIDALDFNVLIPTQNGNQRTLERHLANRNT